MLRNVPWKKILIVLYIILVVLSVLVVAGFLYLKFGVRPPNVDQPTPPQVTNTGAAGTESPNPDESSRPPETPAAVVYKATWPDEMILRCTVDTLPETIGAGNIKKTALIIVGDCMGEKYLRSRLYSPDFSTEFRKGTDHAEET